MSTRPVNLTPAELTEIVAAERITKLRASPEFNKILMVIESAVTSALKELENNDIPRLAHIYALRWRERKFLYDSIQAYIDNVAAQRKDAVREVLKSLGIYDPDVLDRNADMPFADLDPTFGGPNGKQY